MCIRYDRLTPPTRPDMSSPDMSSFMMTQLWPLASTRASIASGGLGNKSRRNRDPPGKSTSNLLSVCLWQKLPFSSAQKSPRKSPEPKPLTSKRPRRPESRGGTPCPRGLLALFHGIQTRTKKAAHSMYIRVCIYIYVYVYICRKR